MHSPKVWYQLNLRTNDYVKYFFTNKFKLQWTTCKCTIDDGGVSAHECGQYEGDEQESEASEEVNIKSVHVCTFLSTDYIVYSAVMDPEYVVFQA